MRINHKLVLMLYYLIINVILGACLFGTKYFVNCRFEINNTNEILLAVMLGAIGFIVYTLIVFKYVKKQWTILNAES